jgi:sarcosine oxidase
VIGVGGFGSSALYHLAKRGMRVLGIEQFGIAHDRGSSHGDTRIIRKAYFEHPDYVPLLQRGYDLWAELEEEFGQQLYCECGLLLSGSPEGEAVGGAKIAAATHNIPIEQLDLRDVQDRFPGFEIPEGFSVVFEPEAGFLKVEDCVTAHIEQACAMGAELKTRETVQSWESDGTTVRVRTDRGEYEAASLIVTAGAWTSQLLTDLNVKLEVLRKPLFWHEITSNNFRVEQGLPGWYFEMPEGDFYGFPCIDNSTLKLAEHSGGLPATDPMNLNREYFPEEHANVQKFVGEVLPELKPQPQRHALCMYTVTADRHFIIDRHPEHSNVIIGAGFSGHGFKFSSVLGETLADLAVDGTTKKPIEFLSINRDGLYQS